MKKSLAVHATDNPVVDAGGAGGALFSGHGWLLIGF